MERSSHKPSMKNTAGQAMSDREVTIFESAGPAIEEAEFCANQEKVAFCVIQFGTYFGVVAEQSVIKEDIVYETVRPSIQEHSIY